MDSNQPWGGSPPNRREIVGWAVFEFKPITEEVGNYDIESLIWNLVQGHEHDRHTMDRIRDAIGAAVLKALGEE